MSFPTSLYSGKMSSFQYFFCFSNRVVKYIKNDWAFFPDENRCDNFSTHSHFFLLQFAIISKTLMSYSHIYQLNPICSTLIMIQEENYIKIRSFSIACNHDHDDDDDDDGVEELFLMLRQFMNGNLSNEKHFY